MYPDQISYRSENVSTDAVRQSHVGASLAQVDESTQALLEAVRELERSLSDVLRADVDSPDKVMSEPHSAQVALAERLTSHDGSIRMARQYVVSILDRLEL